MRLLSEVIIDVKKGLFPQLVFDIYKSGCEVQNTKYIKDSDKDERFRLEIVYKKRNSFLQLVNELDNFSERYKIISVANALEEKIKGGLLNVSGKFPLENMIDYEIGLLGATELIQGKINKGSGYEYSGISKNIGIIGCIMDDDESISDRLLSAYAATERDSVVLSRMTAFNPIPLVMNFRQPDDIIKTFQRIGKSFSAIRFVDIEETDSLSYDQIYSDINMPVTSQKFDDIPLYLLTLLKKISARKKLKPGETAIGIIGINVVAMRCARIFLDAGFYRVLGYDHNEKQMLNFENNGGLATTIDNIFSNTDIVIILKECFDDESFMKIRPGLNIISLINENEIDMKLVLNRGVREFIQIDESDLLVLFPGLIHGIIDSEDDFITDEKLITVSKKLVNLMSDDYQIPDIFSDMHEKIYDFLI